MSRASAQAGNILHSNFACAQDDESQDDESQDAGKFSNKNE